MNHNNYCEILEPPQNVADFHEMAAKKKAATKDRLCFIEDAIKVEIILAWSTRKKTFKPGFVVNCASALSCGEELSPKQRESLNNIICNFGININYWLDEDIRKTSLEEFYNKYEEANDGKYSDWD